MSKSFIGKIVVSSLLPDTLNCADFFYKIVEQNHCQCWGIACDIFEVPIKNRFDRPIHKTFYTVDIREVGHES